MSAVFDWRYGSGHVDRTFHYAIAASLVLHGLLLLIMPGLREGRTPKIPGVLVAHLAEPRALPAAPPPQAPVTRPPEPPKPRAEPRPPPPPVRKRSPLAERAPEPVPPPPVAQSVPPSAEPAPAAPSSAAPGPLTRSDPSPGSAAPAPANADAGSLGDYERRLRIEAAKYKRYPRVAVDNNWEGTVEVTMVVAANGVISSISVKTSSGYKTLDDQALEMFRRAKPLVAIPPALRGKEFTVVLRAIYSLREGEGG